MKSTRHLQFLGLELKPVRMFCVPKVDQRSGQRLNAKPFHLRATVFSLAVLLDRKTDSLCGTGTCSCSVCGKGYPKGPEGKVVEEKRCTSRLSPRSNFY